MGAEGDFLKSAAGVCIPSGERSKARVPVHGLEFEGHRRFDRVDTWAIARLTRQFPGSIVRCGGSSTLQRTLQFCQQLRQDPERPTLASRLQAAQLYARNSLEELKIPRRRYSS